MDRKNILKSTTPVATQCKISSAAHLARFEQCQFRRRRYDGYCCQSFNYQMPKKGCPSSEGRWYTRWLPKYIVVHWGGKITEFLGELGYSYQDVNAVVVSFPLAITSQFLGAPVEEGATGRLLCQSTITLLRGASPKGHESLHLYSIQQTVTQDSKKVLPNTLKRNLVWLCTMHVGITSMNFTSNIRTMLWWDKQRVR